MELSVVKQHIKSGTLNKYYIFTGPEIVVRAEYIQRIAEVKKAPIKTFETFVELSKFARTSSLLSNASIYVIVDDMSLLSDDKAQDVIQDARAFRNDIIILVYNNIDKRNKFYKRFKDDLVEFEYLSESILVKYIQKKAPDLDLTSCKALITNCESDYSRILLELDKVEQYKTAKNMTWTDAYRALTDTKTLYVPPRDAIFAFIDAVLLKRKKLAYQLLKEAYAAGEFTLNLLGNIFNNAKYTLQVQSYMGSGKITDVTGLTPFQVKLASGRKNFYSNDDLINLMNLAREAEIGIKTGKIDDGIAVEYVLAQFWR